jgi:hypothetical protein
MSRAWIVYIVFFAILIGGLWVILTFGTSLRAPDEMAGDWTVYWERAPGKMADTTPMRIAQSGRFFTIRFGDGPMYRYTLDRNWLGSRDGRNLWMPLTGTQNRLTLSGAIGLGESPRMDELRVEMAASEAFVGKARRAGTPAARGAAGAR